MPKLKLLSGKEIVSQRGSHVKLRRVLKDGTKQTLTIPIHDVMRGVVKRWLTSYGFIKQKNGKSTCL